MKNFIQATFVIFALATFTDQISAQAEPFLEEDGSDDTSTDVNKRVWGKLRQGNGLQMLRLGKRTSGHPMLRLSRSSSDSDILKSLSPSDLQELLALLVDEPRDDMRRQPPLPRYGRDSSSVRRSDNSAGDNRLFRFLASLGGKSSSRPAPRGGRYRRSVVDEKASYGDFLTPNGYSPSTKAIPLPRYGRQNFEQADAVNA
ncbi:unnamed protein product [Lymnaea stagnalis]|uniref:Uncharacterized protein n=1 Tax=Lymnaea stagnalis TaxID=6523 RepID=A0AAV2IPM6_LYMST